MAANVPVIKEYLLTTDSFNNPTTLENQNAIGMLLMRLLLLEPGTNPLYPNMGVGINRYRYILSNNLESLRANVEDQVETYMPEYFSNASVKLQVTQHNNLLIRITVNGIDYVYNTEDSDHPIEVTVSELSSS